MYKAVLRETGQDVAVKVQRPNMTPIVMRDLYIFRALATLINPIAQVRVYSTRMQNCCVRSMHDGRERRGSCRGSVQR